ncbi:MAG: beta-hydroxyacyl-ACP dehydratase [Spirochaetia bacterium]|nr:beta-hydroxyacyl-ACP dehydratase [Spirochaetia bacterium]
MAANPADRETIDKILGFIPQQHPFRFIDDILELTSDTIVAKYTFKEDEFFYKGHFPGRPTTPGVILVESMAQCGVVALGLYNAVVEGMDMEGRLTLFTECEVDFSAVVNPGDTIKIFGEKVYMRRGKLKANVRVELEDGRVAASGTLAGQGVKMDVM